MTGSKHCECSM